MILRMSNVVLQHKYIRTQVFFRRTEHLLHTIYLRACLSALMSCDRINVEMTDFTSISMSQTSSYSLKAKK